MSSRITCTCSELDWRIMYVGGPMGGLTTLLRKEINCWEIDEVNHIKEISTTTFTDTHFAEVGKVHSKNLSGASK